MVTRILQKGCLPVALLSILACVATGARATPPAGEGTWPPVGELAGGGPSKVAVQGDYAYVAATGLFTVMDISSPSQPRQVGYCGIPPGGHAMGVAVSGQYAYVASGASGLRVIDVSDRTNPHEVGHWETEGAYTCSFWDVVVVGEYAYVADALGFLRVIDISDPTSPEQAAEVPVSGSPRHVEVAAGYAYLPDAWANGMAGGIWVVDVSDPENPALLWLWTGLVAYDMRVIGSYAYVVEFAGNFWVIDISDLANPTAVGWCTLFGGDEVVAQGEYAYVASGADGLRVIDVSDPTAPVEVGAWEETYTEGVAVAGAYAYLANWDRGFRAIDVSNPAEPVEVGFWGAPNYARGLAVAGGHAYVADSFSGLLAVDVSDPGSPLPVGWWGSAWRVAVSGGYAYVANSITFYVVDVSDPSNPQLRGYLDIGASAVAVAGQYAYVAGSSVGIGACLQVVDVSDPANPVRLGYCETPGDAFDVAVAGQYAYVADWDAGLSIIDISDPANPQVVGQYDTPGLAGGVAVCGSYAYLADGPLRIIDVSDPTNPLEVAVISTIGRAEDVACADGYVYVAASTGGLRVIDVSDPAKPVEVGYWDTPGDALGVAVAGGYVCLADYGWGLSIFPEASIFADVPSHHWARGPIEAIYREGVTTGCDVSPLRYCPDGAVTRGQMAVFVSRAAGLTWLDPGVATFVDVPRGDGTYTPPGSPTDADGTHMFYGWVERLADGASWGGTPPTSGCEGGYYCVDQRTTRAQMATFLCRANGKTWLDPGSATFNDVPRGADGVFTPPIVANGCDADGTHQFYGWTERLADTASWGAYGAPTRGFEDGTFRPDNNCTRAEMAVFLCRAFEIEY